MTDKEQIDRCVECHEPLEDINADYFCDNYKCYRYGLVTLTYENTKERKLN